jgi:hypothetical protein
MTLTPYKNLDELEDVFDEIEGYKRLTVFSSSEEEIKNTVRTLACHRVNVNSFEECAYETILNSVDFLHTNHLLNMQSIIEY